MEPITHIIDYPSLITPNIRTVFSQKQWEEAAKKMAEAHRRISLIHARRLMGGNKGVHKPKTL